MIQSHQLRHLLPTHLHMYTYMVVQISRQDTTEIPETSFEATVSGHIKLCNPRCLLMDSLASQHMHGVCRLTRDRHIPGQSSFADENCYAARSSFHKTIWRRCVSIW